MIAKLKRDPLKIPAPKLSKPRIPGLKKPAIPFEAENRQEKLKKNNERRKVNRGINNGKYGAPVFWTPERNAVVKKLREEGKTYAQIGEELGKSKDAVRRQWYNIRDGRAPVK